MKIDDVVHESWDDSLGVPDGELGEICVSGPVVTTEYKFQPEATSLAKIGRGDLLRHRIGDIGYFDGDGRLWFCGRKGHRLETLEGLVMPLPTELLFNTAPQVHRTALVGVGPSGN